jgi:hypothetical protein
MTSELSPYRLKQYREDGNDLYDYMHSQLHTNIDHCNTIKYFVIRDFPNMSYCRLDEVKKDYEMTIQPELLEWIKNERSKNRLFNRENWKVFPELWEYTRVYIGYRILFPYQQFYFQLVFDYFYNCVHECNDDSELHFQLALYGWNDETLECIQPDNKYKMTCDMSIPEWNNYTYTLE